jgi:hypothetical protein
VFTHAVIAAAILEQHNVLPHPFGYALGEIQTDRDFEAKIPFTRACNSTSGPVLYGHSVGEIAALVVARCMSFETGLRLIVCALCAVVVGTLGSPQCCNIQPIMHHNGRMYELEQWQTLIADSVIPTTSQCIVWRPHHYRSSCNY